MTLLKKLQIVEEALRFYADNLHASKEIQRSDSGDYLNLCVEKGDKAKQALKTMKEIMAECERIERIEAINLLYNTGSIAGALGQPPTDQEQNHE